MARTVKFSKEINSYLRKLLNNIKDSDENTLVFCKNPNLDDARSNEDTVFREYCNKVGFTQKYETTRRYKINLYCFRAYFFTRALRRFGDETAHALTGHGAYLQQYQRRTLDEKIELWNELDVAKYLRMGENEGDNGNGSNSNDKNNNSRISIIRHKNISGTDSLKLFVESQKDQTQRYTIFWNEQ